MVHKGNIITLAKRVADLDLAVESIVIKDFVESEVNADLFNTLEDIFDGVNSELRSMFVSVLGLQILGLIEIKEVK